VQIETFKGLVYKTVHNLCLNEIRKKKLRDAFPLLEVLAPTANRHDEFVQKNDLEDLRQALEALPRDLRGHMKGNNDV
jgi:DNA-directed RNA polymerase specialized sigma24 family protein